MRIAKPLLMITTPVGLVLGLREGYRLAGGLVIIMAMIILLIGAAFALLISTVRRERKASSKAPDS